MARYGQGLARGYSASGKRLPGFMDVVAWIRGASPWVTGARMERKHELLIVAIWIVTFTAAGIWPYLSGESFPLPGLRKLAAADEFSRVVQVLTVLLAGVWLTFQGWQSRERLLVFQGAALALWVQGFLYIGVPFGLAFACFAGVARSRSKHGH